MWSSARIYLPPGGEGGTPSGVTDEGKSLLLEEKVPNDSEADVVVCEAESNCSNGCLRTLHHISHLLVPRKCQLLLQEQPFGDDVVIVPYSIAIGAPPLRCVSAPTVLQ